MRTQALAPLCALVASCTCGAPPGPAVDLARNLCTVWKTSELNRARYAAARERCDAAQGAVFIENDSRKAEIIAEVRSSCAAGDDTYDEFVKGANSQTVRFDSAKLDACLQKGLTARAAAPLDLWKGDAIRALAQDADCNGIWQPLVAEGGACAQAWDCPLGTFCEADDPTRDVLQCLKPAGAGKSCGLFRRCDSNHRCKDSECTPRTANDADCTDDDECFAGSYCSADAGSKCKSLPAANAACPDGKCAEGLFCFSGTCTTLTPAADGEACTTPGAISCANPCFVCRHEETPSGPLKCLARAVAGHPCSTDTDCAAGLYCHSGDGLCRTPAAADADCTAPIQCAEGHFCDPGSTKCAALRAKNESCDDGRPCAEGLFCARGSCAEGKAGDACDDDNDDCDESLRLVCFGDAGAETCAAARTKGQACMRHDQCAKGLFCGQSGCTDKRAVGEACTDGNQCVGHCFNGKCAPTAPEMGCLDLRKDMALYFGMGVLMFSLRPRRRNGRGGAAS
jgi:hypothetical protein